MDQPIPSVDHAVRVIGAKTEGRHQPGLAGILKL